MSYLHVYILHDLTVEKESSTCLLNANNPCTHELPALLEQIHESLEHDSATDAPTDCVTGPSQPFCLVSA